MRKIIYLGQMIPMSIYWRKKRHKSEFYYHQKVMPIDNLFAITIIFRESFFLKKCGFEYFHILIFDIQASENQKEKCVTAFEKIVFYCFIKKT